ncbi:MAG: hypothetical protein H6755_08070 [Candidatus Omnitrophica bacterium]|nr:hypothetical protein [Candidatus Omnitrophota bacterium]MCB9748349.1 hypothetical protein [Candidatus Omnitrophota bacterium]
MKKSLVLTIAVLALSSAPAFAHCGTCGIGEAKGSKMMDKENWMKEKMDKMSEELGLSPEQVTQVEGIMKTKMEKKKAVHDEAENKMEEIKAEYKESLKGVLTPEQLEKYEAMKDEKGSMKGSMKDGKKGSDHEHKGSDHEHKGSH